MTSTAQGDTEMQAGGYGAPEGSFKSAGDAPGNAQGAEQQQMTSAPTNPALSGIVPAQPSSQGQQQQGHQGVQQGQGQQVQWQGQAQQQSCSGQQQAVQPQRQPVCEMIMHPINNSEHHHHPPEGPPDGEPAAQDGANQEGANQNGSVSVTAVILHQPEEPKDDSRPPAPAEPNINELEGSCSLSFLTFLQELEAEGVCALLHEEVPARLKGVSGWSVHEDKMDEWRRRRQTWFMKGKEGRPYKPTSFYQFLRRLGFFPTETTKRATHGLDFEGSKTFKWNGNRRHKYIQSKKEKETLTLEINRRSIIHSDNSAVPVFGAQHNMMTSAWLPPASWTAHAQQQHHQQHQQHHQHMQQLHNMSSQVLTWPPAQHYMQGGPSVWPTSM